MHLIQKLQLLFVELYTTFANFLDVKKLLHLVYSEHFI